MRATWKQGQADAQHGTGGLTFPKNKAMNKNVTKSVLVGSGHNQMNPMESGQLEEGTGTKRPDTGNCVDCGSPTIVEWSPTC